MIYILLYSFFLALGLFLSFKVRRDKDLPLLLWLIYILAAGFLCILAGMYVDGGEIIKLFIPVLVIVGSSMGYMIAIGIISFCKDLVPPPATIEKAIGLFCKDSVPPSAMRWQNTSSLSIGLILPIFLLFFYMLALSLLKF